MKEQETMVEVNNEVIKNKLPLMEAFYTVQGEGFHQGKAAYFIRLGGCDVGCVWCDVKESWNAGHHPQIFIKEIVKEATQYPGRLAVITGGEPLMHDLSDLCDALHEEGFTINIETSGAHPLSGNLDWICLSPKKFKAPLPEMYQQADELKIIIYNKSDFQWAEDFAVRMRPDCKLYLQPEWSKSDKMLPQIIEYVKTHPQWRISLQVHKYMNIP
ncbi:7-carboxy-7-deazaguanine synthase QueE [Catalinimonas niigatensis]|uniref:7-carboxy-7-deazaguanine synthase QueE n=1 Tax=Catalinimonas niigatensis TaxID=1397264 RepID=UPI002666177D|nr:7-carboxy-7-deazaguanine synthase QueE [Catalinimonas niigatensis]WPP52271.1 7-carboxy-7-deazaguanine synthase QueE [Catalinimonas niigatensis]